MEQARTKHFSGVVKGIKKGRKTCQATEKER
jgi:hypothetical protein